MATPPLYKNLGKLAKDLLNKDYEKNLPSLKLDTKAENEVSLSVEGKRDVKTGEFVVDPFQYKYDSAERGYTFVGKATSNRKLTAEFSVIDKLAKGLKVVTTFSTILVHKADQVPDNAVKLGLEYTRDNVAATSDFELVKKDRYATTANITTVVGNKTFALGGEVGVNLVDATPSKYDSVASYTVGNFVVTGSLRDKFNTIGSSFYRKVNDDTSLAGEFSFKINNSDSSFVVGGQRKLDKDTSVKAKLNSDGIVSLSYIQQLRKNVRAVFSTEINALNLNKPDAHKIGFGITFTDE